MTDTQHIDLPDQPDGIEDDTYDLPDPLRAAERVGEYIAANGDGMYDRIGNVPLYARDLEALRRTVEKLVAAPPAEPEYVIWSHHHNTWWGANGSGYRRHVTDAGRYTLADTAKWLTRGCGCCLMPEVVIPAPPAGLHGIALETYVSDELTKANDERIAAGKVNRFAAVEKFNADHPVGTPVRYWKGVREGAGKTSTTRTPAEVLGGHTAVVWVNGEGACIALTHIQPMDLVDIDATLAEAPTPDMVTTVELDGVSR